MLGNGEIDDDLGDGPKCFVGESGITTNELMELDGVPCESSEATGRDFLKRFTTHVGTSSPMGS